MLQFLFLGTLESQILKDITIRICTSPECPNKDRIDGWLDGWMDGWMVGWMDGWIFQTTVYVIF